MPKLLVTVHLEFELKGWNKEYTNSIRSALFKLASLFLISSHTKQFFIAVVEKLSLQIWKFLCQSWRAVI